MAKEKLPASSRRLNQARAGVKPASRCRSSSVHSAVSLGPGASRKRWKDGCLVVRVSVVIASRGSRYWRIAERRAAGRAGRRDAEEDAAAGVVARATKEKDAREAGGI